MLSKSISGIDALMDPARSVMFHAAKNQSFNHILVDTKFVLALKYGPSGLSTQTCTEFCNGKSPSEYSDRAKKSTFPFVRSFGLDFPVGMKRAQTTKIRFFCLRIKRASFFPHL